MKRYILAMAVILAMVLGGSGSGLAEDKVTHTLRIFNSTQLFSGGDIPGQNDSGRINVEKYSIIGLQILTTSAGSAPDVKILPLWSIDGTNFSSGDNLTSSHVAETYTVYEVIVCNVWNYMKIRVMPNTGDNGDTIKTARITLVQR